MSFNKKTLATLLFVALSLIIVTAKIRAAAFCEPCTGTGQGDCNTADLECRDGKCQYACPVGQICILNPLKSCSFQDLIESVTNFIFWLGIVVVPLIVVIAAVMLATSAGNPKQVDTAKRTLLYAAIGFGIILISKAFNAIIKIILGSP